MPTPRFAGPPGKDTKQPPFGKSKSNVPATGPQPPIPKAKPKSPSAKRFTAPGAPKPGMSGFGGKPKRNTA